MINRFASRRQTLGFFGIGVSALVLAACGAPATAASYKVSFTEDQWRKRLTPEQYQILRKEGTERPYTSPLNKEKRTGTYACAGCDNALFASKTKFESGTGWPSFYAPLAGGVGTSRDFKIGYPRTEVHCADCGGHLGHVFEDGPKPTGLRYCMNGAAMKFRPA
ncbi:peptide-methionine (R)-S-oxide reductase MsrB [Altericroceibacterium xinjiangense]|uniref:peptide-methionine (R)-S-oxide reductase MsrB n=1 Tax=Altericroceibacterium xinjiangense TaxID=762261 RepID=UPI000F7ED724|nr:peptide-methionine (R)-S-oxide reductase MsrB [Altericroceibacterium xinjiangense]